MQGFSAPLGGGLVPKSLALPRRSLLAGAGPTTALIAGLAACTGWLALDRISSAPLPALVADFVAPPSAATANPFGALIPPDFGGIAVLPMPVALAVPRREPSALPAVPPSPMPLRPEARLTLAPLPPLRELKLETAPLPPVRPSAVVVAAAPNPVERHAGPPSVLASRSTGPSDDRTPLQKLFGVGLATGAAPSSIARRAEPAPKRGAEAASFAPVAAKAGGDPFAAVYDISARMVTLPDGTKLEAHSGLGGHIDDPRYVSERMRGATPPHAYALEPREASFHGVAALRLKPIGEGALFGRAGLLAHPYMLGPNGDSNGCVSFKDYEAFLRAYRNGQVKRLIVVARAD